MTVTLKQQIKRLFIVIFGLCLSATGKAQASPLAIPGTSVSLDPPPGFTVASNFAGLENIQSGSSITITELPPEAYPEISTLFTPEEQATEALLRQGIAIEEHIVITTDDDAQVPLLRGTQQGAVGQVTKYMALFKGETTVLVTFNIIDPSQETSEIVASTVASVSLQPAPSLAEQISQLSFSFQPTAPFKVADVLGGSTALMTIVDGPDPSGLSPVVIIARGQNVVSGNNLAELSEQLLRGTRGFSLAEIEGGDFVQFAGGPGYRLEASINELTVVQYVHVPDNGRYIRLLATGEASVFSPVRAAVTDISQSVLLLD